MEEAMKREWDAWLEEYKQISSADHIPLELSNKLKSLLLQCVQKGYADVLKEAYEKIPLARRAIIGDYGTALHLAVYWNTVAVESMLESVDPEDQLIQDEFGQTALHIAILERKPKLSISMLKSSPGQVNIRNGNGDTPLILATYYGLEDVCIHMIESASADLLLKNNGGDTALHVAIQNNMPDLCIRMLEISPMLGYIKNRYGYTPLILAIHYGLEDLCIHMIERSFIFVQDSDKNTAFHLAASKGMRKLCRLLIKCTSKNDLRKNNLHVKDGEGNTILHLAIDNGNFEMARQMLQVNPSLGEERNGEGKTPLDFLARRASSVISSRAQLGVGDSLIYHCIPDADLRRAWYNEGDFCKEESKRPLKLWLKIMHKIFWSENRQTRDEENPPSSSTMHNALDNDEGLQKQESWLCKMFYKFLALTLVERVKKIRNEKQQYLLICDLFYKLASFEEESPLFIVAELGLTDVVKKIMNENPEAIHQTRLSDNKNAVLLAAENRLYDVYELLLHHCREKKIHSDIFGHKDDKGNNALHLVAKFNPKRRPWRMPGNTMQMHWEIKCMSSIPFLRTYG